MADNDDNGGPESLHDVDYTDLTNLSRSVREQWDDVDIPTDSPTKDELVEAFENEGVRLVGEGEYVREVDGDDVEVELLESRSYDGGGSSGGPSGPKTVLYCFPRQATTADDIRTIEEALNEEGYSIEPSEGEGDKFMIQRPVDHPAAGGDADAADSESESDEGDGSDEEQDSEDEASDASDEQESDEDDSDEGSDDGDLQPFDEALDELLDMTNDELYAIAVDEDIDGRSSMDKEEKARAIAESRVGDSVAAPS